MTNQTLEATMARKDFFAGLMITVTCAAVFYLLLANVYGYGNLLMGGIGILMLSLFVGLGLSEVAYPPGNDDILRGIILSLPVSIMLVVAAVMIWIAGDVSPTYPPLFWSVIGGGIMGPTIGIALKVPSLKIYLMGSGIISAAMLIIGIALCVLQGFNKLPFAL